MAADRIWSDQKKGHNLLQKNTVIISTVKPTQNIEYVDCVLVPSVNYEAMKTYLELECAYVWGIEENDRGELYPVELSTPIGRSLIGWASIHKSNKILSDSPDVQSSIRISKAHLTWCINESFNSVVAGNSTQKMILAESLG